MYSKSVTFSKNMDLLTSFAKFIDFIDFGN